MRRAATALLLLPAIALAGCSGDDEAGSGSSGPSATKGSGAGVEPGTSYPVAPEATPSPEPALGTKKGRDGWVLTLTSVRRVADDRVVVEGSLDGRAATSNFSVWTEPAYKTLKGADGEVISGNNGEFSAVTLTVAGDPTSYLPVRDKDNLCLCTRLGPVSVTGSAPVYVVMSAPEGATEVTLAVNGAGSFGPLKVEQ